MRKSSRSNEVVVGGLIGLLGVGNGFVGLVNNSSDGRGPWIPAVGLPGFVISSNVHVGVVSASGSEGAVSAATVESLTITAPTSVPSFDGGADDGVP
jgi:hypothetical protein